MNHVRRPTTMGLAFAAAAEAAIRRTMAEQHVPAAKAINSGNTPWPARRVARNDSTIGLKKGEKYVLA